jgi:hypothetical protein
LQAAAPCPPALQAQLLEPPEGGSNWSRQWTRSQPIRTAAEISLSFSLLEARSTFAYQRIASEALRLNRLGMPASSIARLLNVTDKTVAKAIRSSRCGA